MIAFHLTISLTFCAHEREFVCRVAQTTVNVFLREPSFQGIHFYGLTFPCLNSTIANCFALSSIVVEQGAKNNIKAHI